MLLSHQLCLAIGLAAVVSAAPTSGNIALARKYAPQWRFHTSEEYWPSSVEYFLSNVDLVDSSGKVVNSNPTVSTVDDTTDQGSGLYLASGNIDADKKGWLRGQNPANTPSSVYTFIVPKDNGVVDLFYWLFTPFNLAKSVPVLGQVGDHVGDWERMTVRTVDGVATQVDYHAHSDTGSTIPWGETPKFDSNQRPIGYVALGSHGFWQAPGTFTYVDAVIFKLQDKTSDGGVYWDTKDSLVPIAYPDTYAGNLDWLNYKGRWGNQGEDNCWWHFIYSECEITDGPTGPVRSSVYTANSLRLSVASGAETVTFSMDGPLSQVLGDASTSDSSSYTFYLADGTSLATKDATFVGVQQTCESLVATKDESGVEVREKSTTFAAVPYSIGSNKFTVTPAACAPETRVIAYSVGLCTSNSVDECSFPSSIRSVKAFSKEEHITGGQDVQAIELTDLDNWRM